MRHNIGHSTINIPINKRFNKMFLKVPIYLLYCGKNGHKLMATDAVEKLEVVQDSHTRWHQGKVFSDLAFLTASPSLPHVLIHCQTIHVAPPGGRF